MDYRTKKNMFVKIFKKEEAGWDEIFYMLPKDLQDPFFCRSYFNPQNIFEEPICFVAIEKKNIFYFPFLKTKINDLGYNLNKDYYDIQGIYGYNGILTNTNDFEFIQKARDLFISYCQQENIIAEFMRFNPIYQNHKYFLDMTIIKANKNIVVDLMEDDILMNSYKHSTRKNIKKAMQNNLTYKIIKSKDLTNEDLDIFSDIYLKTMIRNNASFEYILDKKYFSSFRKYMPNNSFIIFIYKDETPISTELVLYSKYIAYSFLGGTLNQYYEFRPNDYLKHITIEYLKNLNINYFCLGGGVTLNDGIYKYKESFAKNGIYDFYIGKRIYNNEIYDLVVKQWKNRTNKEIQNKYDKYLLKFHYFN